MSIPLSCPAPSPRNPRQSHAGAAGDTKCLIAASEPWSYTVGQTELWDRAPPGPVQPCPQRPMASGGSHGPRAVNKLETGTQKHKETLGTLGGCGSMGSPPQLGPKGGGSGAWGHWGWHREQLGGGDGGSQGREDTWPPGGLEEVEGPHHPGEGGGDSSRTR